MKRPDERERSISGRSALNGFAATHLVAFSALLYQYFFEENFSWEVLTVLLLGQLFYWLSLIYYRKTGLKR